VEYSVAVAVGFRVFEGITAVPEFLIIVRTVVSAVLLLKVTPSPFEITRK
jgi:hypothetical protein